MIQTGRNVSLRQRTERRRRRRRRLCSSLPLSLCFRSLPGGQRSRCHLISDMFEEAPGSVDTRRRRRDPTRHVAPGLDGSPPPRDVMSPHSCRIIPLTLLCCGWSVSRLKGWLPRLNGGLWDLRGAGVLLLMWVIVDGWNGWISFSYFFCNFHFPVGNNVDGQKRRRRSSV